MPGPVLGKRMSGLGQHALALVVAATLATTGALALPGPGAASATGPAAPSAAATSVAATSVAAASAAPYSVRSKVIGYSVKGRAIRAYYRGYRDADHVLLVLGQMHGDEKAGTRTALWVASNITAKAGTGIWVIPTMNPDGNARGTRVNARGVDLNRNWPTSGWTSANKGSRTWGGPRPASEPETRAMMAFLREVTPNYIASIHQPLYGIGKGPSGLAWQRRLSSNLGLPRKYFGVGNPSGTVSPTMTAWYERRLGSHGVATTIEYGARPGRRFVTVRAGYGIARAALVR